MTNSMEQDAQILRSDWERVGNYLSLAMQEIAAELGGEEFALRVGEAAVSDSVLPNPDALKLLEESYPGSAEKTMTWASEIQAQTHERELVLLRKPSARKYGKALLDGFASIGGGLASIGSFGYSQKRAR